MMRKRFSLHTVLAIALLTATVQADTIRLKNGSILKGKVTSFSDDQFVVMIDSGSGRYLSKATIFTADIAKIEFDAAPSAGGESAPRESAAPTQSEESTPRNSTPAKEAARENTSAAKDPVRESAKDTPPVNPVIRNNSKTSRKSEPKPEATEPPVNKDTDAAQPEKSTPEVSTSVPETAVRKPLGPNARTVNVEVAAKRDWTSSGVIVKRGDKLRITATGNITLDPAGQTSGPEGIDAADTRKLITDKPTGGLIGVIGADNDEFIFIGRSTEFTATRDGLLFLSVNEGTLSDNSGSFKAVIEIAAQRSPAR